MYFKLKGKKILGIPDLMAGYPAGYRIPQIAGYPANLLTVTVTIC
jgi:hypothetical protein